MPRFDFRQLPFKNLPRDFERKFEKEFDGFREFSPRFREFLPKFKDEEFRFEFRKKGDKDDEEKSGKKPEERKKDDKKKF